MTSMLTLRPRNKFLLDVDMNAAGRIDYQDCRGLRGTEAEATRPTFAQEPALLSRSVEEIEAEGFRFCSCCHQWLSVDAFHKRSNIKRGFRYECALCRAKEHNRKLEYKRRKQH